MSFNEFKYFILETKKGVKPTLCPIQSVGDWYAIPSHLQTQKFNLKQIKKQAKKIWLVDETCTLNNPKLYFESKKR